MRVTLKRVSKDILGDWKKILIVLVYRKAAKRFLMLHTKELFLVLTDRIAARRALWPKKNAQVLMRSSLVFFSRSFNLILLSENRSIFNLFDRLIVLLPVCLVYQCRSNNLFNRFSERPCLG